MLEITWKPSPKQKLAFDILNDKETTELFFGGGAGGGKSHLGCVWIIYMCLRYPGTRYLIGRAHLTSLKQSTLLTFFSVLKEWGLSKDFEWVYNSMNNVIRFSNESEVYLKDLFKYPSDPEFDSLGSTEYTAAFIDEGSQVDVKAKNIVMSRLRYKLEEYDLIPKLLIASNPSKNFLYYEFYKPWRDKCLINYRKFIPALVTDNPFISPYYIENLKKLDKISKERLLYGNFEYDDDPARLFEYDKVLDMFHLGPFYGQREKYLTVDVARFGSDKTVICLWKGFYIERIAYSERKSLKETKENIEKIAELEGIPRSHIIIDEDGVGGGVVDFMQGVKGFVNNSSPKETKSNKKLHNFKNLKAQCYYLLAEKINRGEISIYETVPSDVKDWIIEDLEQIKARNLDKDTTLQIMTKEEIKERLGRSPDFSDAIMMRMYFELETSSGRFFI
jgi:phage terminase large subunit